MIVHVLVIMAIFAAIISVGVIWRPRDAFSPPKVAQVLLLHRSEGLDARLDRVEVEQGLARIELAQRRARRDGKPVLTEEEVHGEVDPLRQARQ